MRWPTPPKTSPSTTARIAEAKWFTRDEVRAALQAGDWSNAKQSKESKLLLPGSISIARVIIESWAALD